MTIEAIESRAANEAALHAVAVEIRKLLDKAAKEITLPDDRDVYEEVLALVNDDE